MSGIFSHLYTPTSRPLFYPLKEPQIHHSYIQCLSPPHIPRQWDMSSSPAQWSPIPGSTTFSCVTLEKFLNHSVCQFSSIMMGFVRSVPSSQKCFGTEQVNAVLRIRTNAILSVAHTHEVCLRTLPATLLYSNMEGKRATTVNCPAQRASCDLLHTPSLVAFITLTLNIPDIYLSSSLLQWWFAMGVQGTPGDICSHSGYQGLGNQVLLAPLGRAQ
jgi:hypothetical protein